MVESFISPFPANHPPMAMFAEAYIYAIVHQTVNIHIEASDLDNEEFTLYVTGEESFNMTVSGNITYDFQWIPTSVGTMTIR